MRRYRWIIVIVSLLTLLGFGVTACGIVTADYLDFGYPGAIQQSENREIKGFLGLNSAFYGSFRTSADFADVVSWYVQGYDLATGDRPAHATCFKLYGDQTRVIVKEVMVVDVCQTSGRGQLIYVKRFFIPTSLHRLR